MNNFVVWELLESLINPQIVNELAETKCPKTFIYYISILFPTSSSDGVTEEQVRRYLTRKPMTTTELLQKFKSKKLTLSSEQLVPSIAQILKKINPHKQMIKGKMYLSMKP